MAEPKIEPGSRITWTRPSSHEFPHASFVAMIMAFMAGGVVVASFFGWLAQVILPQHKSWIGVITALAAFCLAVVGQGFYEKHDEPVHSLLGYFLVAAPFGVAAGYVLGIKDVHRPMKVVVVTFCLVCVLGLIGATIKRSLDRYWPWLIGALIALIIGQFVTPLFGFGAIRFWDWVGIAIFSFIVVWNFNHAVRGPHTLDKSIDWAAENFIAVLNIALRGNPR